MNSVQYNFKIDQLRGAIQKTYGELACDTNKTFHFTKGRILAERAGYEAKLLDLIPPESLEAFAGVGNPFSIKPLKAGITVVDIGSGAGTDSCVAALKVGNKGKVYGIDMTPEMIETSRASVKKMSLENVVFIPGFAENLPLPDNHVDMVISNGVINLCPDKSAVYKEIFRILKPGGIIQIADVFVDNEISPYAKDLIHLWVDCVAGGMKRGDYESILKTVGFKNITIGKDMDVFKGALIEERAARYGARGGHVYAEKSK